MEELTKNIQEIIRQAAEIGAMAAMAAMKPQTDKVSQRQAEKLHGRAWLQDKAERGLIHASREGFAPNSPVKYSRREIAEAWMAEHTVSAVFKNNKININF